MSNPIPYVPVLCAICKKPVALEDTKTDTNAQAVHEECYIAKVRDRKDKEKNRE